jgi:hypothetical protein
MKIFIVATNEEEISCPNLINSADEIIGAGHQLISDPSKADLIIISPGVTARVAVIHPKVKMMDNGDVNAKLQSYNTWDNFIYRNLWK